MPSANARALLGVSQPETRSAGCDDSALVRQARAGQWKAFAQLAGRYDGPILALALRLTGSEREAEELAVVGSGNGVRMTARRPVADWFWSTT